MIGVVQCGGVCTLGFLFSFCFCLCAWMEVAPFPGRRRKGAEQSHGRDEKARDQESGRRRERRKPRTAPRFYLVAMAFSTAAR